MTLRKQYLIYSVAYLLVCWVSDVHGQLNYTAAERELTANADNVCDTATDGDFTVALGVYSNSVSAVVSESGPMCQGNGDGMASQNSNLGGSQIIGVGSSAASGFFGGGGDANSRLEATFALNEPTPYTFSGTLTGIYRDILFDITEPGSASVSLVGIHDVQQTTLDPEVFSFTGTLPAGTYTLSAIASSFVPISDSTFEDSAFDFTFVVPEPNACILVFAGVGLLAMVSRMRLGERPATKRR